MKGQVHCGRIVVSGSWEFCPFCGKSLAASAKQRAKSKQTKVVPLATQIPVVIAGKTHFLNPGKNDLQMTTRLPSPCTHTASRGKPKGKKCRITPDGHEGRHRY